MKNMMLSKNNKGASLVLVIIAMFFVGLIASIVLSITVGNAKSTRTTVESSENFYSSEGALDDLKMFLKKLATSAATDAYAATLEKVGIVSDIEDEFEKNFREAIKKEMTQLMNDPTKIDANELTAEFLKNYVTFDRPGDISIKFSSFDSTGVPTLKGVVVTLTREDGYQSILKTDIQFNAAMPSTSWTGTADEFKYGIDHFIIISGGDIKPASSASSIGGGYTGNIYTEGNFVVRTTSATSGDGTYTSTNPLNIRTHYLLTGKNFVVDKGVVSIAPVADKSIMDAGAIKLNAEVWCNNLKLGDSRVVMNKATDPDDSTKYLNTQIYLRNNLELNGNSAQFKANGGGIYGYSGATKSYLLDSAGSGESTLVRKNNPSSAIILNGLGARLDLSGLDELQIAGQAYTALSSIDGVNASFKDSTAEATNGYYFTQGESITYRALQAMYLIPGDNIKKIGHNPMKEQGEYKKSESGSWVANITAADIDIPKSLEGKLTAGVFKSHIVRYVGGENYVYLFWDFAKPEYAVTYFQSLISDARWKELSEKQADLLNQKGGYIKLPASPEINGNALKYESNTLEVVKGNSVNIGAYSGNYDGLMAKLDKSGLTGKSLLQNMFKKGLAATPANEVMNGGELQGPFYNYTDKEGKAVQYDEDSGAGHKNLAVANRKYQLWTGPNVTLPDIENNVTYIIITPGNVTLPSDSVYGFRGLIIAGGEVNLPANLNMECLGMITRTPIVAGVKQAAETSTEFKYLLGVVVDDSKKDNPNTRLRTIFGVADTSGQGGSSDGSDFVTFDMIGYELNSDT